MELLVKLLGAVGVLVWIPWLMWYSMRWARNRDSPSRAVVGNALQELDRLVTRPSVKQKVGNEHVIVQDDEIAGD